MPDHPTKRLWLISHERLWRRQRSDSRALREIRTYEGISSCTVVHAETSIVGSIGPVAELEVVGCAEASHLTSRLSLLALPAAVEASKVDSSKCRQAYHSPSPWQN